MPRRFEKAKSCLSCGIRAIRQKQTENGVEDARKLLRLRVSRKPLKGIRDLIAVVVSIVETKSSRGSSEALLFLVCCRMTDWFCQITLYYL